jgi:hypothetical protein
MLFCRAKPGQELRFRRALLHERLQLGRVIDALLAHQKQQERANGQIERRQDVPAPDHQHARAVGGLDEASGGLPHVGRIDRLAGETDLHVPHHQRRGRGGDELGERGWHFREPAHSQDLAG